MSYVSNKLPKSQVEITVTVPPAEYQKELERAAVRLSERAAMKGFRPGKAPYDIVKQQLGEQKIMEEALEKIVQHTFFDAVKAENLNTVGAPKITIEKMAPGNELIYKAVVALLPHITLPDFSAIKVERKETKATNEDVERVLTDLKKMQPKETPKAGAADKENKITIDMDMFIERVPVEGGQAKNHQVYLSEPHYIPGLAEQLVGLKKDDTKEFTLPFPKDHYQKHLADRMVDFKIKVNDVFGLEYPELDETFAKSVGQESMEKLKELLLSNLSNEAEKKENQRLEIAILEALIEKSTFEEIPEVLIDTEKRKMFYELKADLDRRGMSMEQYMLDLKKTETKIFEDFAEGAFKRAKAALTSRQIAKDNAIVVSPEELKKEVETIKQTYAGEANVEENLKRPEVLDTIAMTVQNRKVLEYLKEKILPKT